jgi:hypothetical protein
VYTESVFCVKSTLKEVMINWVEHRKAVRTDYIQGRILLCNL